MSGTFGGNFQNAYRENRPMKFGDLYERAEVALVEAKKLGKSQTMISKGLPMEP